MARARRVACSAETANHIDVVVSNLINTQYHKAYHILKDNANQLHALAKYLYEHETITGDEFMDILHKTEAELPQIAEGEGD